MSICSYCAKDNVENKMVINTWDGTVRKNVTFYYCSGDCKIRIEEFSTALNAHAKHFLILILLVVIAFILFPLVTFLFPAQNLLVASYGIPLLLLGVVLCKYPFATPESTSSFGIKKSKKLLKSIGRTFICMGIFLTVVSLAMMLN